MALRNIRTLGDNILRKKSRPIDKINDRILTLIEDMKETMYEAQGVGLAAPQVGILKRLVVIDVGEGPIVLINPEIIETKGNVLDEEGCLSIPDQQGKVERPEYVKAKALNEKGEAIIIEGRELLARAICHELDHLDGVLYIDKIVKGDEK
ncbi:peptide deformylase 1 [Clostridium pasteurianum DSM 525 = ATCC 6013]|uniref:Peptide deformylase n=1 Tax=Clostridium pasteurianum DSM 525 = ATCC 6013 TaxID=1262449 RepID=A0A0H3JA19_CLOPA|nr:peptide deformylase [Clostridium pasteurianum]AJA48175.1 peptide deformylase 1 [Clostridium pasteurianum DSM 525 = ATCC 6013]AJA52163.1 peptide deformylase 1 [Clostridium pasteurianum DSM 525 = ATCC 6013]AOZ75434.1 peptide deformylase [Clostridium pasteurianum DSM 525 = ATCC 6013]AOZ79229.1 peptide deformylase [Clostridium pasteurianum]ELP60673.1 peptide deformylase [Clostridium pasteurianum DSM 525 = ATCC 6013]